MLRCDKCESMIPESDQYRTRFIMEVWCMDIRHAGLYTSTKKNQTGYSDLCAPCQDAVFAQLEVLAKECHCAATKAQVSLLDLAEEERAKA